MECLYNILYIEIKKENERSTTPIKIGKHLSMEQSKRQFLEISEKFQIYCKSNRESKSKIVEFILIKEKHSLIPNLKFQNLKTIYSECKKIIFNIVN